MGTPISQNFRSGNRMYNIIYIEKMFTLFSVSVKKYHNMSGCFFTENKVQYEYR